MSILKAFITTGIFTAFIFSSSIAQDIERWDKQASEKENPNAKWFKEAKFGMFIHWGLYSIFVGCNACCFQ